MFDPNPTFVEPNSDMLAILRLYLEKREAMGQPERELFLDIISAFVPPKITLAGAEPNALELGAMVRAAGLQGE